MLENIKFFRKNLSFWCQNVLIFKTLTYASFAFLATFRYIAGTTIKVKTVDTIAPPIIATAIGDKTSDPGPSENAACIAPAMVEMEVIRIGLTLFGQALISASLVLSP